MERVGRRCQPLPPVWVENGHSAAGSDRLHHQSSKAVPVPLIKTFGIFARHCVFNRSRLPRDMTENTPNPRQFEASGRSDYPSYLKGAGFPEHMTGTVAESFASMGGSAPIGPPKVRFGSGTVIGCGGWYEGHASAKRSRRVIAQPLGDTINHAAQCLAIGRLIPVFSRAPDWALLWPDQASRPGGRDWEPIASFRSRWPAGPLSRGPYIENWLSIVLFQLSTKAAASWTAASNSLSLFTRVAIPSRTGWAIPEGR